MGDDFSKATVEIIGRRVGYKCCNPTCNRDTCGPHTKPTKWTSIGEAAHITAASPGGPRFDPAMASDMRRSAENGIWLCSSCHTIVDTDVPRYPTALLREWKCHAESAALVRLNHGFAFGHDDRPVDFSEPIQLGAASRCLVEGQIVHLAAIESVESDPTFYASACVFRLLAVSRPNNINVMIHGFYVKVDEIEPVPTFQLLAGAYPLSISLYKLRFGNPQIRGHSRFDSIEHYSVSGTDVPIVNKITPVQVDAVSPVVLDVRLSPDDPGLYTLRIGCRISSGTTFYDVDAMPPTKFLVPEPLAF